MYSTIVELLLVITRVITQHHNLITDTDEFVTLDRAAKLIIRGVGSFYGPVIHLDAEGLRNVIDSIVDPMGDSPQDFWSNGVGCMVFNLTEAVFEKA